MNTICPEQTSAQTPLTEKYDRLDDEACMLRSLARRLRDEGDFAFAAETEHDAEKIEVRMEEIITEEMSPAEQRRYWA